MKHRHYLSIFFALSTLLTSQAEALVASIKNAGMANTGVAYPQDTLAAAYNPAGMIEVGDRIDLGLSLSHYEGKTRVHDNRFPGVNGTFNGYRTKNFYPPSMGFNYMFNDCTMAAGLSIYEADFLKTSYSEPFVLLGTSPARLEYVHYTISPNFAFRLGESHSLGISLNAEVQRLRVDGLQKLAIPFFSSDPKHVTNKGHDLSWGFSATFGWLWQAMDCLKVGLTVQTPAWMQSFKKYRGFVADHGRFNPPPYINVGLAWNLYSDFVIAFDVQYLWWESIRALKNPLEPNLENSLLGEKDGVGFGWKNQVLCRLGCEYAFNDEWTFRLGYRYGRTPIRRKETVTNQLTLHTVESFVTCGATWNFDACHDASIFYAHGFENEIKGKNSIPTSFGGGNADIKQQIDIVGISWGMIF